MERSEIERQIRAWKDKGYDVSSVESNLDAEPSILAASVVAMRDGVKKAEAVGEMLAGLDVSGFESRAAILREKLKDPVRHPDIDTEVESLRDAVESLRQIEARRQVELERGRDSQERTRKVLDLVMKQQQALRPEAGPYSTEDVARKVLEDTMPARDASTNLVQTYTFESFIVGESNRFAHGAAVAVAKQPAKEYNPLLITSGPGLGKTHLLHAIGNYVVSHAKESKVLYLTCETFASSLAHAQEVSTLAVFADRIRGMDCLLIDDIQFLSDMPEVHEELFHTFNDLHDTQKQIVLASDRAPKAIPNLDERLISRFESGLVAGLEPPDLLMRVTILERRARDENVAIEGEVLTCIANLVTNNVRELGGAFNRVVAFSSLMHRPLTQDLAREVLSGATAEPTAEPIPQPVHERIADERADRPPSSATATHELTPGRSYLIEEERPARAFRLLTDFLGGGGGGLVITRTNPKRVRQAHDLPTERVLWLTDREGSAEETIAPALERIVYEIEDFMGKQTRGAILLDGIEYLVSNSSFDAVLMFVRRLLDAISESRYAFIISLGTAPRDASLPGPCTLLPARGAAGGFPPVERFAAVPEESLGVAEDQPHAPRLAREAIAAIDHLAGLVEVLRIGLERAKRQLEPVPGRVVVARLQPTDGLLELRGRRLDARIPFRGAQFLEERVDLAADEVDERHVERASGVRDERDRALDVASLPRLDRVVDDPFPVIRETVPATRAGVRVRRDRGLAHGAFVFRCLALGEFRAAARTHGRVRRDQRLADGAEELLAEIGRSLHGGSRFRLGADLGRFGGLAGDVLERLENFAGVFLPFHDRGEDFVDAPACLHPPLRRVRA